MIFALLTDRVGAIAGRGENPDDSTLQFLINQFNPDDRLRLIGLVIDRLPVPDDGFGLCGLCKQRGTHQGKADH
jgi:hypothetical protein